ncbi:MAG: class I SAM-dependent methyltransferase [Alphaproteobacteria bacterium]|nr:class I SAM-dependent methyltransferase [Alphaproteobacteria bacterium]
MFSEKFEKFIEIWLKDFAFAKTLDEKACVDASGNPIPWYTYPAIEYLSQFDFSGKKVFEFGCGNSSRWWANRVESVISVEDNPEWLEKWQKEFSEENIEIRLRDEGKEYYEAINEKSDELYDIIVVDGKKRAECAEVALKKLAKGGIVILDDSDRINTSKEYVMAVEHLKQGDFIQVDFYGFCPMTTYPKTTTLFLSRNVQLISKFEVQPISGIGNIWKLKKADRKHFFKK